jgi:transcriptional regulator with XRE-family HTH domain
MEKLSDRLRSARISAGFETAAQAADAMGVTYPTYVAHENGNRGPGRELLSKYAKRFKVTTDWLLDGKGDGPVKGRSASPTETSIKNPVGIRDLDLQLFNRAADETDELIMEFGEPVSLEKRHKLIRSEYRRLRELKDRNLLADDV